MKDLKRAHGANELDAVTAKKPAKVRHFIFEGVQGDDMLVEDIISVPLCGDMMPSPIATNKPGNVTCHECLVRLKTISSKDSYAQVLTFIKSVAPQVFEPDMKIVEMGIHSGEPREKITKHINAHRLLQSKFLKKAADIPTHMIGSKKETFYRAMMKSRLVWNESDAQGIEQGSTVPGVVVGEYNPDTAARIDELIEIFK